RVTGPSAYARSSGIVAAVELPALSKAFAPETSATTAMKIAMILISILLLLIFGFGPASQQCNDSPDRWRNVAEISSEMLRYWLMFRRNHFGILCSQMGLRNGSASLSSEPYDTSANAGTSISPLAM